MKTSADNVGERYSFGREPCTVGNARFNYVRHFYKLALAKS